MATISPEMAEHPDESRWAYYLDKQGGLRQVPREDGFCRYKRDRKTKDIVDLYVAKGYRAISGETLKKVIDEIKARELASANREESAEAVRVEKKVKK